MQSVAQHDIACSGWVRRFKQEGRDLIIVDTSGRHKQSGALFEEMRQVLSSYPPWCSVLSSACADEPPTPTLA